MSEGKTRRLRAGALLTTRPYQITPRRSCRQERREPIDALSQLPPGAKAVVALPHEAFVCERDTGYTCHCLGCNPSSWRPDDNEEET
jgi:hypothetical protein